MSWLISRRYGLYRAFNRLISHNKNYNQYMRNNTTKWTKMIHVLEKMVNMFNAVVSMECMVIGDIKCLHLFLDENQFFMKLIFGKLSHT